MLVALPGSGAAQPRRRAAIPFLPAPVVRSATDASGRSVAWSVSGSGGPPTVEVSGLPTHLLLDWRDPLLGDFQRELGAERRLLRHDRPGTGLCGGAAAAPHLDATALDAVVAASGEGRVALLAHSFGAAAAVELCLRRPQAVSHLVLFGAAARLHDDPGSGALTPQLADALARLARADWQLASRTLADLLLPGADSATLNAYAEHLRTVAGGEAAAEMLLAVRDVALRIAGARLEVLDGAEHLPHAGDTASVSAAIARFLSPAVHPLTRREIDVLRQIGEGLTNQEAGAELGVSEATVARHLANVYAKLDVATRGAAVARARRWGLL